MKIVILDGHTINPGDLSWDCLKEFGDLTVYEFADAENIVERIGDADAIITDSSRITEEVLSACPDVKVVCELATGYNNIDVEAAKKHGIAVYNVPKYSTEGVVQQTIALILQLSNHINENSRLSEEGQWFTREGFRYSWAPLTLLNGKSLGIIGYGNIGKRVAEIAEALGMTVNIYSRDKESCMKSDIISLHCPATEDNYHMVDKKFISEMKDGAILINTARGALLDEKAVADALNSGKLSGFGADVLEEEPPESSPLIGIRNSYITPHVSWVSKEIRQKLIDGTYANLKAFIEGTETESRIV